ncbi:MAG TPA: hypothetical protein VMX54_04195 [Vicinamibacteria bacterium]|nr:hypothetical protein [Vicinamibacteria bacterium]
MSEHPDPETLVDLATGGGIAEALRHLEACAACAARVSELRETLALAAGADLPEPPGAYWEAFRRNLGRRISTDRRRSLRWVWLAPVAAAAAAVAFAVLPFRHADRVERPAVASAAAGPSWSALPPIEEDAGVPVLEAVVATDEDAAALQQGPGLGAFLGSLSDEESRELAEALQQRNGGAL